MEINVYWEITPKKDIGFVETESCDTLVKCKTKLN